jgi:hypothetical protein
VHNEFDAFTIESGVRPLNDVSWSLFTILSKLQVFEYTDSERTISDKVAQIFPLSNVLIRRCRYVPSDFIYP